MSVTTAQATTLLENVLFESPTLAAANAASWVAQSIDNSNYATVEGLAAGMAASPEMGIVQQVVRYYEGALGRAPGGFEIEYYVEIAEQGLTPAQIAQGVSSVPQTSWDIIANDFANSPEFTFLASSGATAVNLLYTNILRRLPGASEVAYYLDQLSSGFTIGTLVQEFTNSPEYQTAVNDTIQTAVTNYGLAILAGNAPTTIPLAGPNQTIIQALGADDITIEGKDTTQTVTVNGQPASAGQAAVTAVVGVIGVSKVDAATGVQGVAAVAAVAPVAGQSAIAAASDGAVTITDAAFSKGGAGTITTVTLNNSGANSVVNANSLANLTLSGTAGTLTINDKGTGTALTLTVNGLTNAANTITDSNNEVKTLNIVTAGADSTLAAFADTNLTTINLSGTNTLTLSAINSSLTALNISGAAGFSDGATTHAGGLAALGSELTIALTSTGTFSAALDDTKQSFTGGPGTDIIMVAAGTDATQTLTAGAAANNEIVFEGGSFGLTSASSGKFVNFQTVGVAGNVTGTIDLSIIDPTATGLDIRGANTISFTHAAAGTTLMLAPSTGAIVSVNYANPASGGDSITIDMASDVASLQLLHSDGTGIGTVSITNDLAGSDTNVSPAHILHAFDDKAMTTLNVAGDAGLDIPTLTLSGSSFALANTSGNGRGVTIDSLTDDKLTSLGFSGTGISAIGAFTSATTTLSIANSGTAIDRIDTITAALTSLTLTDNIALGQAATPDTTNGLQDSATSGVTISGAADNAHVTINLTNGANSGATDSITLGNGNNVVVDGSVAGAVNITLGSGANLVELGSASGDTTAAYSLTLAARTAQAPNIIVIGTAGNHYASAANLKITGVTDGDIVAFGNDTSSSAAALTATALTSAGSEAAAIGLLEAAANSAHRVAYGVYNGNTYLVETTSGAVSGTDTTVVEISGVQTLTASLGYVTIGSKASTLTAGSLSGGGFAIPAGTATNLTLKGGTNFVTLTGASNGVVDNFTGIGTTTGLAIDYQATSGTDTVNLSALTAVKTLSVKDEGTNSAGITIGAFTDNALTTASYDNSATNGGTGNAVVTQQTLTSSSLATINFTGNNASQNRFFFTGVLTNTGGVTINDSSSGSGITTLGLTLSGGPNALTLNMTGAGKLVTGVLTDNNLGSLTINGSGGGAVDVGTLVDSTAGGFTVNDNSTSSGGATIRLSGLSAATTLTINDNSAGALTDNSAYSDSALTTLNLKNSGSAALTVGGGGITANALQSIAITGSGSGSITVGALSDSGSGPLAITDSSSSSSAVSLPLNGVSAATTLTVTDSAAGNLDLGILADNALATLSLTNSGTATLSVGTIATQATSFTLNEAGNGALTTGAVTANNASALTFNNAGTRAATIGITDTAGTVGLTLGGSGTGTDTVSLTLGTAALTINDGSSSTGAATVTIAAGSVSSASLSNTGHGDLTVTGLANATAGGFTGLTLAGSGKITTALTAADTNSTVTVADSGSGAATITTLNVGAAATDTATVQITNSGSGTLTIQAGTVYATSLTLTASGLGSSDITLSDLATAPATITLSGSGRQSLILTHDGISGDIVNLGAGPANLTLHDSTGTDIVTVAFGSGSAVVAMDAGRSAGSSFTFLSASASSAATPVTANVIKNFLLDSGAVQGDVIGSGFAAGNILTTADVNPGGTNFWSASNGMLSKSGANVLNFIQEVQSLTQAGGAANTNGVAGFLDGQGNTWIAYNDHAGHVAVIELTGVTAAGLETLAANTANFIHIG